MAFTFEFDKDSELAVVTLCGRVDGDETLRVFECVVTHPKWQPSMSLLWDIRQADPFAYSLVDAARHAEYGQVHAERYGPGKTAVVVRGAVARRILEQYVTALPQGARVRQVFTSIRAARLWLNETTSVSILEETPASGAR